MSSLSSILSKESLNTHMIYFYREGVFYKAYEQSAYLFVSYVKPFQVKKKNIKSVNQEVVSIGFPTKSLINYFPKDKIKETGNTAEVELDKIVNLEEFLSWKQMIEITLEKEEKHNASIPVNTAATSEELISTKIKLFPMEQKTPLDCMLFLLELKKTLQ